MSRYTNVRIIIIIIITIIIIILYDFEYAYSALFPFHRMSVPVYLFIQTSDYTIKSTSELQK